MKKFLLIALIFISCGNPTWICIGEVKDYTIIDGGLLGSKYYLVDVGIDRKYEVPYSGPSSFSGGISIGKFIYWNKWYGWKCE